MHSSVWQLTVLYLWELDFIISALFLCLSWYWVIQNLLLKYNWEQMRKTRGSYKLCIMFSALDYSKPQQLKITHIISPWHHSINSREQWSTTHFKWVTLQRKPFFWVQGPNIISTGMPCTAHVNTKMPTSLGKTWLPTQIQRWGFRNSFINVT